MRVHHPFQRIVHSGNAVDGNDFLVAAAGPHIFVLNFKDGAVLSRWPYNDKLSGNGGSLSSDEIARPSNGEPPEKRRKISKSQEDGASSESSTSVEIETERVKGQRRKPKPKPKSNLPNVSHLLTTSDGRHTVAITAEDKCIRVFEIGGRGTLTALSERCMPKRPCAIVLDPEQKTLFVADKFGDVYCMPLFPSEQPSNTTRAERPKTRLMYEPGASELTVHSKRNLEALRQQRLRKASQEPSKEKSSLNFEHTLILGHVSLLTDLKVADLPPHTSTNKSAKRRRHIITTDRDEHIRVSRGPPQSHIIEANCHGHKDFVTKVCQLPWQPQILVAGSGGPSIRTYIWPEGRPLSVPNHLGDSMLFKKLQSLRCTVPHGRQEHQCAVSGLWTMEANYKAKQQISWGFVFVAIEGLPILLTFIKTTKHGLIESTPIHLSGNVLDVLPIRSRNELLISIDNAHAPGSTNLGRSPELSTSPFLQAFTVNQSWKAVEQSLDIGGEGIEAAASKIQWDPCPSPDLMNQAAATCGIVEVELPLEPLDQKTLYSPLGEFLYGLENLRKKPVQDERKAEEEIEKTETVVLPEEMGQETGTSR
ncbi:MAG: hypothetical protein Q9160_007360 [Pyrenula sp. 1 TL-2023]